MFTDVGRYGTMDIIMNTLLFARSGRLFASPSAAEGMSRVLDILGNHDVYNEDVSPQEADCRALYSDWAAVGDHLVLASKELIQDAGQ